MFAWLICCLMLVSCLSRQRLTEDALYCAGECELLHVGGDNLVWSNASILPQVCLFSKNTNTLKILTPMWMTLPHGQVFMWLHWYMWSFCMWDLLYMYFLGRVFVHTVRKLLSDAEQQNDCNGLSLCIPYFHKKPQCLLMTIQGWR